MTTEALQARIAQNLRRLRGERGFSCQQVATKSGLHIRQVQKVESGSNATLRTVAAIAAGLGVDPVRLFACEGARR